MIDKYDAPMLFGKSGRQFHVMVKPIGSTCNLDCTYCYYLSKEQLFDVPAATRMNDETLERLVQQYIDGVTTEGVLFTWQGGEPTLLGLEFFRKAVAFQQKYKKPNQRIENDLQTNGTLLNEEWCEFLRDNKFLVGLSIDGPRDLHDHYRVTKGNRPTFDKVLKASRLLRRYGVPFNTLTCVHRFNARKPLEVYRFLRNELGSTYIQFIPIVEPKGFERTAPHTWDREKLPTILDAQARPGHPESIVTDWSVDPEEYGLFLSRVFDEWLKKDVGRVLVNHFETLVAQHLGLPSQICIYNESCGKGVVVEHDGNVYSCDHYVYPEYLLTNITRIKLEDQVFSRKQVQFGYAKSESLPQYCRECPYLTDCWGECPKNRFVRTPDGEAGLNYLCPGLKRFYRHAIPKVDRIVTSLKRNTRT
jgi:uncharacterized protein